MNWEDVDQLEKDAPLVIDSAWHYSWHWDRTANGHISLKGWRQALDDATSLRKTLEAHLERITDVQWKIAKHICDEELRLEIREE